MSYYVTLMSHHLDCFQHAIILCCSVILWFMCCQHTAYGCLAMMFMIVKHKYELCNSVTLFAYSMMTVL